MNIPTVGTYDLGQWRGIIWYRLRNGRLQYCFGGVGNWGASSYDPARYEDTEAYHWIMDRIGELRPQEKIDAAAIATMRAKILAVSQCATLDEIRRAVE